MTQTKKVVVVTHLSKLLEKIKHLFCQVRRLGGGVYVIQASWSMEDHGSVRRVSLGGRYGAGGLPDH
jgi:hypothetical protein